jgi:site-specific recombinase XerD
VTVDYFERNDIALTARVDEWRTWQQAQSLSQRTIVERTRTVMRMAEWTGVDPEVVQSAQIVDWLAEGGDWAIASRASYFASLSAWFRWLTKQEYRLDDPMDKVGKPRRPRCEPRPISDDGMRRLLRCRMNRRTRAIVLLASMEGLRVHEIAKLRGEHFDLVGQTMVVVGKGGVTATLPIHPLVLEIAFTMPRKGFWFPGIDHGHQRRESISDGIKQVMVRAGVLGSAHQLRHYFGTALVRAGVDLRTVQTLMRHSNLTSTAIYTQIADEQRTNGIQRLDPFGVANLKPARQQQVTPEELRQQAAELLAAADRLAGTVSQ